MKRALQDIEKDVGEGCVGVNLDPANLLMYGKANPVDALEVFGEYAVSYTHLNDVFDVISTDHAPHTMVEKGVSMKSAPFGIVGLETSVSLTITELVDKGWITPMQMAEKMSYNPAQILHLTNKGSLKPGKDADVVVIDPKESYVIDVKDFVSKGKLSLIHILNSKKL